MLSPDLVNHTIAKPISTHVSTFYIVAAAAALG